jgi:hypothetical protein
MACLEGSDPRFDLKAPQRAHTLRTLEIVQLGSKGKVVIYWTFAEPSDGIEPSTPPYHALQTATGGSRPARIRGITSLK